MKLQQTGVTFRFEKARLQVGTLPQFNQTGIIEVFTARNLVEHELYNRLLGAQATGNALAMGTDQLLRVLLTAVLAAFLRAAYQIVPLGTEFLHRPTPGLPCVMIRGLRTVRRPRGPVRMRALAVIKGHLCR